MPNAATEPPLKVGSRNSDQVEHRVRPRHSTRTNATSSTAGGDEAAEHAAVGERALVRTR